MTSGKAGKDRNSDRSKRGSGSGGTDRSTMKKKDDGTLPFLNENDYSLTHGDDVADWPYVVQRRNGSYFFRIVWREKDGRQRAQEKRLYSETNSAQCRKLHQMYCSLAKQWQNGLIEMSVIDGYHRMVSVYEDRRRKRHEKD